MLFIRGEIYQQVNNLMEEQNSDDHENTCIFDPHCGLDNL